MRATLGSKASREIGVVSTAEDAANLLDVAKRELLELLKSSPDSASGLARRLGQPRQRVNYHLRALERAGLVRESGRRQRRGLTERLMEATARHYAISPAALGALNAEPSEVDDRFSSAYQIAVASRTVRDVARLTELALAAGKPLPTLTVDAQVKFADVRARDAFATELMRMVTELSARYGSAESGYAYRFVLAAHPSYDAALDAP